MRPFSFTCRDDGYEFAKNVELYIYFFFLNYAPPPCALSAVHLDPHLLCPANQAHLAFIKHITQQSVDSGPIWKCLPSLPGNTVYWEATFFFFWITFSHSACFILHSPASLPTNLFTTKPNPSVSFTSLDSSAVFSLDWFHLRHSISFPIKLCSMLKSRDCSLTQQYPAMFKMCLYLYLTVFGSLFCGLECKKLGRIKLQKTSKRKTHFCNKLNQFSSLVFFISIFRHSFVLPLS